MKKVFCAIVALMIALTSCTKKDGTRIERTKDGKFIISEIGDKPVGTYDSIAFQYTIRQDDYMEKSRSCKKKSQMCDLTVKKLAEFLPVDNNGVCQVGVDGEQMKWVEITKFHQTDGGAWYASETKEHKSLIKPVIVTYKKNGSGWNMGVYHSSTEILACNYKNLEFVGDYIVAITQNDSLVRKIYYAPYPCKKAVQIGEIQRQDIGYNYTRNNMPLIRDRQYIIHDSHQYLYMGNARCMVPDDALIVTVGANKEGILCPTTIGWRFFLHGKEVDSSSKEYPAYLQNLWTRRQYTWSDNHSVMIEFSQDYYGNQLEQRRCIDFPRVNINVDRGFPVR